MQQYIVISECVIQHNDKFLIIKRPPGKHAENLLSLVGGKFETVDGINPDQDALITTIKREVMEEVGLILVDPIQYLTTNYFLDSKSDSGVIDVIYYCNLIKTATKVTPKLDEVPEHYWLTYKEIIEKDNCPPWLSGSLELLLTRA